MKTLGEDLMRELLAPYLRNTLVPDDLYLKLSVYLDLLTRWNERTNLTAIRVPDEIVQRHFGESLFLGTHLPSTGTLLDYGSGAGFPGLPIQLLLPNVRVTLAESQGKKASFLREAIRVLGVRVEVWPDRVEAMPPEKRFDVVTLRAVDKMEDATKSALTRVIEGGTLAVFATGTPEGIAIPGAEDSAILIIR